MECLFLPGEKTLYQIMPYFSNNSLSYVAPTTSLQQSGALIALLDICQALITFGDLQIPHGNLKPSNILIDDDNRYVVSDYCKYILVNPLKTSVLSNYEYLSPEVLKNEQLDITTDMWSFGCIIYFICSGNSPFIGDSINAVTAHILSTNYQPLLCDSHERINGILSKLLVVDRKKRLTARELYAEFRSIIIYSNRNAR